VSGDSEALVPATPLDWGAACGLSGHCYESKLATLRYRRPTYTVNRAQKFRVQARPHKSWISVTQSRRVVFYERRNRIEKRPHRAATLETTLNFQVEMLCLS